MLSSHISLLNQQAEHLFEEAKKADKIKDKVTCTNLGLALLEEARAILKSSKQSSVLVFFEFMVLINKKPNYKTYLEFTVRNNLDMLSQPDYYAITRTINSEMVLSHTPTKKALKHEV